MKKPILAREIPMSTDHSSAFQNLSTEEIVAALKYLHFSMIEMMDNTGKQGVPNQDIVHGAQITGFVLLARLEELVDV
jgi:hypothetical protein